MPEPDAEQPQAPAPQDTPVARDHVNPHNPQRRITLGLEIDPRGGAQTTALFAIGRHHSGHDPLLSFAHDMSFSRPQEVVKESSNLYTRSLLPQILAGKTVCVRAYKSGVTKTYSPGFPGEAYATYWDVPYPTEEQLAQIHLFLGDRCLTGSQTFEGVVREMRVTEAAVNKILIRLDADGRRLLDVVVDGVVHVKDGARKVHTAR